MGRPMKIKFSLEIHLDREKEPTPEPPYVATGPEALVELAVPAPIGFSVDMPDHE